jgi:site-specific DNA recombinase
MNAAIYARVSTERQEREQTSASQVALLVAWVHAQGHELRDEHRFVDGAVDEGYSGARLDRPGLDRLRDAAHEGAVDLAVVLSPDRLARKYAYQVLLLEELRRAGCRVVFLQHPISDDPDDHLLLQIQGAIAEYERAVMQERFRRGKLHRARAGQYLGSTWAAPRRTATATSPSATRRPVTSSSGNPKPRWCARSTPGWSRSG